MIERKDIDGIRIVKLAHGKVSAMDIELGEALIAEMADAAAAPITAVIITGTRAHRSRPASTCFASSTTVPSTDAAFCRCSTPSCARC